MDENFPLRYSGRTEERDGELVCPFCKMTYNDFLKTGLVGCEECYRTFYRQLAPVIRRCQGTDRHVSYFNEDEPEEETQENNFLLSKELEENRRIFEECIRIGDITNANGVKRRIEQINRELYHRKK